MGQFLGEEKININDEPSRLVNDPQNKQLLLIKTKSSFTAKNKVRNVGGMYVPESTPKSTRYTIQSVATNFTIKSAERMIYEADDFVYSDEILLICETNMSKKFAVRIDSEDFDKCIIKSAFEKQTSEALFSADITTPKINKLLFNFIRSIIKEHTEYIPSKPGFWLNNDKYSFISHNPNSTDYETDAISEASFDRIECITGDCAESFKLLKLCINNYKNLAVLALFSIASFLYTPFKNAGYGFNRLIAVTGCDTKEKLDFLTAFFKVFKRDTEDSVSLDITESRLKETIFSRKDEVIIFEDDVPSKSRLSNSLKILSDFFVKRKYFDGEKSECNALIICSQAQTMELLKEYSESLIWVDLSDIDVLSESIDRIISAKKIIQNATIKITKSPQIVKMYCNIDDYNYEISDSTFRTLVCVVHTVEFICDSVLTLGLDMKSVLKDYVDTIVEYIKSSENFFNPDKITEDFQNTLSCMIEQGEILFEYTKKDNLPVAYLKDEFLLFSVNDFALLEKKIPFGLIDSKKKMLGVNLRSILYDKGYLLTNNGEKMLYKASLTSGERCNFVALKKNFLTQKVQDMLPVVTEHTRINATGYLPPDNNDIERIVLGHTEDTGSPVYWSIGNSRLSNKHLYIQADSGSGKTTLLFLLAQRLHKAGKNVIILDFAETESYSKHKISYMNDNLIKNTGCSVFENGVSESDIKRCDFKSYTFELNNLFINTIRCTPIEAINILKNIFNYLDRNNQNRENDVYIILDEINSLNFYERFSENNDQTVADVIFRQGRSIGLNLVSATQFLSKKGSKNKALLFNQSATKIALHMNSSSSTGVAKSISVSRYSYYKEVLEKMTVGQAIVYSGVECDDNSITNDMPLKIKISPFN